jgi:N-acetylglucosamine-6-sulfatase
VACNRLSCLSICLTFSVFLNIVVHGPAIAKRSKASPKSGVEKVEVVAKDRPNILFILTDDQRLEDIQHMPTLQKLLVAQGMSFDNYFSNVSLCCPSRTSILRGQCAHNTGVLTNGEPNGGYNLAHRLGLEDSTIATWMHGAGYRTALIGKYLNHYPGNEGPAYVPPGWDYWASAVEGNPYSEYNYTLNENGKSVDYGSAAKDYGTDVYTGKAIDFIKSAAKDNAPFFMYLAFYAPHGPATPAPRHVGMFTDLKIVRSDAYNEKDVSTKPQFIQRLAPMSDAEIHSADAYLLRIMAFTLANIECGAVNKQRMKPTFIYL